MFYAVSTKKKQSWLKRFKKLVNEHRGHKKKKVVRCPVKKKSVEEIMIERKVTFDRD